MDYRRFEKRRLSFLPRTRPFTHLISFDPAASDTVLAFPSVNFQLFLVFPRTAVKVPPFGNRRSPPGNGLSQNTPGLTKNFFPLGFSKRCRRPQRRDARCVQDFAGVNVADAGNRFRIHQQCFDVNPAPGLALHEVPEIKAAHQIIGQGLPTGMDHPDSCKAAGIDEIEVAVNQRHPPSRMRLLLAVRPPEQPSRHAQMNNDASAVMKAHLNGLSPAANPANPHPADIRDAVEFVIEDFRRQNFLSGDFSLQLATQRFNFGQLRHSRS